MPCLSACLHPLGEQPVELVLGKSFDVIQQALCRWRFRCRRRRSRFGFDFEQSGNVVRDRRDARIVEQQRGRQWARDGTPQQIPKLHGHQRVQTQACEWRAQIDGMARCKTQNLDGAVAHLSLQQCAPLALGRGCQP